MALEDTSIPVQRTLLEKQSLASIVSYVQELIWPIMQVINALVVRDKHVLLNGSDIKKDEKYIFIANHQSRVDAFILISCLQFSTLKALVPFRFFAYNGLFNYLLLLPGLLLFGCFPASKTNRYIYGLDAAEKFLSEDQTIFIFPEGKRNMYKSQGARSGVAVLAQTTQCQIVPGNIIWYRKGFLRWCSVIIGKPTKVPNYSAEQIMKLSYDLRETIKN